MSTRNLRRRSALGALVCALLVAAGTLAVARVDDRQPVEVATGGEVAPAPAPPPAVDTSTTTASTVAPSTTTTATIPPAPTSTTTRAPSPKPATTTTTRPPASTFGPRNPGAVVFPYEAGRATWEGVSNGVILRVRVDNPAPRAGDPVQFSVEAETADHACCGLYLLYGDGGSSNGQMVWPGGSCDTAVPGKSAATYTHAYNKPGRWEFSFQAVTGRCGVDNIYTGLHGYLEVAPGVARSQGPAAPVVRHVLEAGNPSQPPAAGSLQVWAEAEDIDGFISGFVVDFGDGTPAQTYQGDRMGCRPTPSGWPARSLAWLRDPYAAHQYTAPGTYTVTVTAVSTGCDGGERQTVTATMTYVW